MFFVLSGLITSYSGYYYYDLIPQMRPTATFEKRVCQIFGIGYILFAVYGNYKKFDSKNIKKITKMLIFANILGTLQILHHQKLDDYGWITMVDCVKAITFWLFYRDMIQLNK